MNALYKSIATLVEALPPDCIRLAAKKLRSGTPSSDVHAVWGVQLAHRKIIADFTTSAVQSGLSDLEVAIALESAAETAESIHADNSVDILWTGPKTTSVPVRRMEQSLCELIDSAKEKLLIVSFVAYKAEKIYAAITSAIERGQGLVLDGSVEGAWRIVGCRSDGSSQEEVPGCGVLSVGESGHDAFCCCSCQVCHRR